MEWIDGQLFISVLVTLFVLMDPPATVPLFIPLTADMTSRNRNRSACRPLR